MKLVYERDPQARLIHLQLIVQSGSRVDGDLPGLAYFTARALLRGTRARSFNELNAAIETLGADLVAGATPTRSILSASVLAQNLDRFLELLGEVLTEPAFVPDETEKLRTIVTGELQSELQEPRELASRGMLGLAYGGTPWAAPVHGTIASVSRIQCEDARAFFAQNYTAANILIGASGPLSEAEMQAKLDALVSALPGRSRTDNPRGKTAQIDSLPLVSVGTQRRRALIVPRQDMSTVPVFIASPAVEDAHPDRLALECGNFVFGEDFTSRLMQILRAKNGWTYGAYSGFNQLLPNQREPGLFSLYFYPSAEFVADAIPTALSMYESYSQGDIQKEEWMRARAALINAYPFRIDTVEKRLAGRLRQVLTGRALLSPLEYRARLEGLSVESLNEIVRRRASLSQALIVAVGDPEALQPVLAALPLVESVDNVDIQP